MILLIVVLSAFGTCGAYVNTSRMNISVIDSKSIILKLDGDSFSGCADVYGVNNTENGFLSGGFEKIKIEVYKFERSINRHISDDEMKTLIWKNEIRGRSGLKLGKLTKVRLPGGREGFVLEYGYTDDGIMPGTEFSIMEIYGWTGKSMALLLRFNKEIKGCGSGMAFDMRVSDVEFADKRETIRLLRKSVRRRTADKSVPVESTSVEMYRWTGSGYVKKK
jgi:hypothetical protein